LRQEVTIIHQISEQQLIKLTPEVAKALGMAHSGLVEVQVTRLGKEWQDPPVAEQVNTEAGSQIHSDDEVKGQTDTDKEPVHITIINNIITPQKPLQSVDEPNNPAQANNPGTTQSEPNNLISQNKIPGSQLESNDQEEDIFVNPPLSKSEEKPSVVFTSKPKDNVQIMLGPKNPKAGEKYRLLVGSYATKYDAELYKVWVQAAGFDAELKKDGNSYNVYAVGIPASMVLYASLRLGQIGFEKVLVQE
jgi:cell division protein FtsN